MKKFEDIMKVTNEIDNISVEDAKEKLNDKKCSIYRRKRQRVF